MSEETKRRGPVQFRGPVETQLEQRCSSAYSSLGAVAERDLERYYYLLERELRQVELTEGEAMLICDALNSTLMEAHTMRLLWAEIEDALTDDLAEKWAVDGPALVSKLHALTLAQAVAVVDAAERFWRLDGDESNAERVRAVGLVHL